MATSRDEIASTYSWGLDLGPATGHDGSSANWAHHGIAVTAAGHIVTMSPPGDDVIIATRDGNIFRRWRAPIAAGHGLRLANDGGDDVLWIADNGVQHPPGSDGSYPSLRQARGQYGFAVKFSLEGDELLRLTVPPLPLYADGNFAPTDVAVDEERFGGDDDIWVADGYGRHVVHRYDKAGTYLSTIDGTSGLGQFIQPHSIVIDRRLGAPRLLVTDRGNSRMQAFTIDGQFLGGFGTGTLDQPSGLAIHGTLLFVADLRRGVYTFDEEDRLVRRIADTSESGSPPGWPNALDDRGLPIRPPLSDGLLNSPHGIAIDNDGRVFVAEWCIGGRVVRLDPDANPLSLAR